MCSLRKRLLGRDKGFSLVRRMRCPTPEFPKMAFVGGLCQKRARSHLERGFLLWELATGCQALIFLYSRDLREKDLDGTVGGLGGTLVMNLGAFHLPRSCNLPWILDSK